MLARTLGDSRRAERSRAKCQQRRVWKRKNGGRRQDFHHKAALVLARKYDTIYHEALQVANLVQHHHLAKCICDAGWSGFLSIFTFNSRLKAPESGW